MLGLSRVIFWQKVAASSSPDRQRDCRPSLSARRRRDQTDGGGGGGGAQEDETADVEEEVQQQNTLSSLPLCVISKKQRRLVGIGERARP